MCKATGGGGGGGGGGGWKVGRGGLRTCVMKIFCLMPLRLWLPMLQIRFSPIASLPEPLYTSLHVASCMRICRKAERVTDSSADCEGEGCQEGWPRAGESRKGS